MSEKEIRGHCLCGSVRYRLSGEPNWCAHCHCSDCRRHVGGAVATFIGVDKQYFSLEQGEFASYESSPGVTRSFCGNCGTPMAYVTERIPAEIHLYLGTLEQPEAYPAQLQVFCRERLPWFELSMDGPSFQGLPE